MTASTRVESDPYARERVMNARGRMAWMVGSVLTSPALLVALVGLGFALRVREYLANRSLWIDEAFLALNIIDRSPSELLGRLDFNQAAAPAFLLLEDLVASVAGASELALRVVPLIAGITALACFALLARRLLSPLAATVATGLTALSPGLVSYSAEAKPYAVDVAATCVLLLAAVHALDRPSLRRSALLGWAGICAGAVSFASVFVVIAIAAVLLLDARRAGARRITAFLPALLPWALGLVTVALVALTTTEGLRSSLRNSGYYVDDPLSLSWLKPFTTDQFFLIGIPREPAGLPRWVAAATVVLGVAAFWLRDRRQLLLLALPVAGVLLAATGDLYPLTPRTTLFLVPGVVLLSAEGILMIYRTVARVLPRGPAMALAGALGVCLLGGQIHRSVSALAEPSRQEELRPVLEFVARNWHDGDRLVLHYASQYAFRYYQDCGCHELGDVDTAEIWPVEPAAGRDQFAPAFRPRSPYVVATIGSFLSYELSSADEAILRRPGRMWFVYSHVGDQEERDFVRATILPWIGESSRLARSLELPGAAAYLYVSRR